MSTDAGAAKVMTDALNEAKALIETAAAETEQMDLLDPVSPEDMVEARERLGLSAGNMAVLREARKIGRGRPKGARNKRTDDFARYLLSFGQHPAITMMQIQSTPPEVLMEASRREKEVVLKGGKHQPDEIAMIEEETLTYEGAQSLRIRCAEGLLPYLESKKPVAIDANVRGVMVVEEIGDMKRHSAIIDGEVLGVGPVEDGGGA